MPRRSKPKKQKRTPGLRLHEASGQGFVELCGRRIYLGRYELDGTRANYHRVILEWEANGRTLPVPQDEITVAELLVRFYEFAKTHYRRPDGSNTRELGTYRLLCKLIKEHCGGEKAIAFGPRALRAIRAKMIESGNCRRTINKDVSRIRSIFKWAVSEQLIPPQVHQALQALTGLKYGRTEAPESEPVTPVPEAHIAAIEPYVSRQVWAMVQLQLYTGARSGDVEIMRGVDIDTRGATWLYRPQVHKLSYREQERIVFLGPRAQEIVRPFLDRPVTSFMFSPQEADAEHRAKRQRDRKTPESCGNVPGSNRKRRPRRKPGERYTSDSYRRAIQRACVKAKVPSWHPHQLRHNAGTRVRAEFGIEMARVMLGVRSIAVAQIYAERDLKEAVGIAAKIG